MSETYTIEPGVWTWVAGDDRNVLAEASLEHVMPVRFKIALERPAPEATTGFVVTKDRPTRQFTLEAGEGLYAMPVASPIPVTVSVETTALEQTGIRVNDFTGWADYIDTEFTEQAPFVPETNRLVLLPNNAGEVRGQLPIDVAEFYNGQGIVGRINDSYEIKMRFKVKNLTNRAPRLRLLVDIGGAVGVVEDRLISLANGKNKVRPVHESFLAYTLDTWEANGGSVMIEVDRPVEVWGISFVMARIHKARQE